MGISQARIALGMDRLRCRRPQGPMALAGWPQGRMALGTDGLTGRIAIEANGCRDDVHSMYIS